MLEVKNLHKIYKNGNEYLHVLKGINLKIERGDFLAICGPSGAGKSTLLHLLGALDSPSEGEIIFERKNLRELTDSQISFIRNRKMGFVFQFYHLLPEFNVLENVMIPALINPIRNSRHKWDFSKNEKLKIREKATELLEIVGLEDKINYFPSELSGGEKQRIAIVRALINSPDIIFCDEPTGNLDSENSKIFLDLLKRLNQKNLTILIVTHNSEVACVSKKILYIRDGMIYNNQEG